MSGETVARKFRGFISYSKKDKVHAARLHKALEAFRVPKGAVGEGVDASTRRLGRFFRDDDEMGAASNLGAALRGAIEDSDCLIVVCSPGAAQSAWVNQEIVHFKLRGRAQRIFAVIVEGTPHATNAESAQAAAQECFPPALRFEVEPGGMISGRPEEPLAIDLRKESFARVRARLAAGLLDVNFDDLWRRDQRRTQQRRASWAGAAVAAVAVATLGTLQVMQADSNARSAQKISEAERTARQASDANAARALQSAASADELARTNANVALGLRAQTLLEKAENVFNIRGRNPQEDQAAFIAQEEAMRWSAAALLYGLALLNGEAAIKPQLDRLGYVALPIKGDKPRHVEVAADGQVLVVYGGGFDLRLISPATGKTQTIDPEKLKNGDPYALGLKVRSDVLLAGGEHQYVRDATYPLAAVDLRSGKVTGLQPAGGAEDHGVWALSDDGRFAAAVSARELRVWRMSDGREVARSAAPDVAGSGIPEVTLSVDGGRVFLVDSSNMLSAFDVAKKTWTTPTGPVTEVSEARAVGQRLLIRTHLGRNSEDKATLWNSDLGRAEFTFSQDPCKLGPMECVEAFHSGPEGLQIAENGRYMISTAFDGAGARIHDLQTGKARVVLNPGCTADEKYPGRRCSSVIINADPVRPRAAVTNGVRHVRIIDLAAGKILREMEEPDDTAAALALTPDGARIIGISGGESDNRLVVWDVATGAVLSRSSQLGEMGNPYVERMTTDASGRIAAINSGAWVSLAPARETAVQALERLCAMRGAAGLPLEEAFMKDLPAGAAADVCTWPRPSPAP